MENKRVHYWFVGGMDIIKCN